MSYTLSPMSTLTDDQVAFLLGQRVARLGTVDAGGHPHVMPVCFGCADGVVYTAVDEKPKRGDPLALRRIRNIVAQPGVCLLVDRYDDDWSRLAWLQVRGQAGLVTDPDERARAFATLRDRYPQYHSMDLESRPLIRITPTQVVEWSASESVPRS